nr:putative inactive purple acid phosphatase 16 [Quercus suber]
MVAAVWIVLTGDSSVARYDKGTSCYGLNSECRYWWKAEPSHKTVPGPVCEEHKMEAQPWATEKSSISSPQHPTLVARPRRSLVKMFFALITAILLAAWTFAAPTPESYHPFKAPLRFTKDGTFQISIFNDLHFGENAWDPWGPQQDINSIKVINSILDAESQQLVVLNGDLITGENTYKFNSTHYVDQIVGPLVERGLTWASTYGNHDSNYNLSRELILAREHRWPNARTQQAVFGKDAGVSNYYLPVYSSDAGFCPELILWFFDSRGGNYYQQLNASGDTIGQPDWVDQSVVDWFQQSNAELRAKYHKTIPSLAFVHIPTNASTALQTKAGVDPNHQPGINDDYPLAQQAQGWCPDGRDDGTCEYGGQDVPFMQAITTTPGLMAVFSGHDHGDTWCYKWDTLIPGMTVAGNGVNLCFGQHSGYGGYGTWIRGSRQVLVTEDMLKEHAIDTWIRLEDGDIVGSVSLNSTYNEDIYPETPNTMTHCPTC